MSCISSQMNRMMGQGSELRSTSRVVKRSMDRVRFVRTRKIELGRASDVHFPTHESSSGSLGQRSSDQGSLTGWLYLGNGRKGQETWVK